jgi:hypothetical protein
LCLNITLWGRFLREICPFKKMTPNNGCNITAITGKLLVRRHMFLKELLLRLNRTLWGQFLREICPFNSSPAIMPLAALYFGVNFLKGHFSLKNGTYCPLLATIQPFPKTRAFLLSYKYSRGVCMGRTSTANRGNN